MAMVIFAVIALGVIALGLWFTPTPAVFQRAFILLGSDTVTFQKSDPNENLIILIQVDFNPLANPLIGSLTEATFDGYAARAILADGVPQSNDPATGDSLLDLPPNATSYLWETSGVTNLPQTIFGYAVVNSTKATLYGSGLMPNGPVILTAVNQSVQIPRVFMRMLAGTIG